MSKLLGDRLPVFVAESVFVAEIFKERGVLFELVAYEPRLVRVARERYKLAAKFLVTRPDVRVRRNSSRGFSVEFKREPVFDNVPEKFVELVGKLSVAKLTVLIRRVTGGVVDVAERVDKSILFQTFERLTQQDGIALTLVFSLKIGTVVDVEAAHVVH